MGATSQPPGRSRGPEALVLWTVTSSRGNQARASTARPSHDATSQNAVPPGGRKFGMTPEGLLSCEVCEMAQANLVKGGLRGTRMTHHALTTLGEDSGNTTSRRSRRRSGATLREHSLLADDSARDCMRPLYSTLTTGIGERNTPKGVYTFTVFSAIEEKPDGVSGCQRRPPR